MTWGFRILGSSAADQIFDSRGAFERVGPFVTDASLLTGTRKNFLTTRSRFVAGTLQVNVLHRLTDSRDLAVGMPRDS